MKDDNVNKLIKLLKAHSQVLFQDREISDISKGCRGVFNEVILIDFTIAFKDSNSAMNLLKLLADSLGLNDDAYGLEFNEDGEVSQFSIELYRQSASSIINSAFQRGFTLP